MGEPHILDNVTQSLACFKQKKLNFVIWEFQGPGGKILQLSHFTSSQWGHQIPFEFSIEFNKQQLLNTTGHWLCLVPTVSDSRRLLAEISWDFTSLQKMTTFVLVGIEFFFKLREPTIQIMKKVTNQPVIGDPNKIIGGTCPTKFMNLKLILRIILHILHSISI